MSIVCGTQLESELGGTINMAAGGHIFRDMSSQQRRNIAEDRLESIVDDLGVAVHLHEANKIVCYSDQISRQVPHSYAGNAYRIRLLPLSPVGLNVVVLRC